MIINIDRVSCDSDSLYYMPNFLHEVRNLTINNQKRLCVEFCISEQWAVCYALDVNGEIIFETDQIKLETIKPAIINFELA